MLRLVRVLVFLCLGFPLLASEVAPMVLDLSHKNGDTFKAIPKGNPYMNWMETTDGYTIVEGDLGWYYAQHTADGNLVPGPYLVGSLSTDELIQIPKGLRPPMDQDAYDSAHEPVRHPFADKTDAPFSQNVLTLLVSFSDISFTYSVSSFEDLMYGASDSVKEFFLENSYNQFTVVQPTESQGTANDGIISVTLGYNHPNQGTTTSSSRTVAIDAVAAADAFIDYSSYDTDGDGDVSADELSIVLILAGYENSFGGSSALTPRVWGHKSSFSTATHDGVDLSPYTMFGERHATSVANIRQATIGIMCHELGHLMFGLPDLYDINGGSNGIGDWGLMGGGSWNATGGESGDTPAHFSAWCKDRVGFSTAAEITSNMTGVTIDPGYANDSIKKVWIDQYKVSEYFLLEYRQRSGYDAGLDGDGVMIWHVDDNQFSNADEDHKWVDVEAGDGQTHLDTQTNDGDGGDPWPGTSGATTFNDGSTPNTRDYDGNTTNIAVTNIADLADGAAGGTVDITATAPSGDNLRLDDGYTGNRVGYGNSTAWTAVVLTNDTGKDTLDGFQMIASNTGTVDFYLYESMTGSTPTNLLHSQTGYAVSGGWNRLMLTTPQTWNNGDTRVMVLKIVISGETFPAYYDGNSDFSGNSYLDSNGSGSYLLLSSYGDLNQVALLSGGCASPTVTDDPDSQTVCERGDVTFDVTATGDGLTYQWQKDGQDIGGATSNSYTINDLEPGDGGDYRCVVTGTCGSDTSAAATLTVTEDVRVTDHPDDLELCEGSTAVFSVSVSGDSPTYQWRKNNVNIPGATSSTLTIEDVSADDEAEYKCRVTNSCGSTNSLTATLSLYDPPMITGQPSGGTVCEGGSITFSVTATGDFLAYQWRKDGQIIADANASSLTIDPVTANDGGTYTCVVSSQCGSATSDDAVLTLCAGGLTPDAHYSFENNFDDSSGNGHHATGQGSPEFGAGQVGNAAVFDGSNDLAVADQVLNTSAGSSFTLSAWVKISSNTGWKTIIGTDNSLVELAVRNAQIRFGQNGGGWWLAGPNLTLGQWYHVTGTYDGSQATLYVDGAAVVGPIARTVTRTHGVTVLGSYSSSPGELMNGCIDEARIFTRALSASEVEELYDTDSGGGGNEPPTIEVLTPNGELFMADASFNVSWTDSDSDDDATVALYYDNDNSGSDGTLIQGGISEDDATDQITWNTSGVTEGSYYIYAVIDDGTNPIAVDYSATSLTVTHSGALVGQYEFEDNFDDSSGFGNDASGNASFGDGPNDRVGVFDGVDDKVDLGQLLPTPTDTPFTLSTWAKIGNDSGWKTLVGTDNSNAEIAVRHATVRFGQNGGGWWLVGPTLTVGTWYQITATYDGSQARLYVDGALVSGPVSRSFSRTHGVSLLGTYRNSGGEWMNGCLDLSRIFTYALNDSQVLSLYQGDVPGGGNEAPTIEITYPTTGSDVADRCLPIAWMDSDSDNDASISLYYDTDNSGNDGTLIVAGLSENDTADSYDWNTTAIAAGDYYIYAVIDDGVNSAVVDYSDAAVTIAHGGTPTHEAYFDFENDFVDSTGNGHDGSGVGGIGFAAGNQGMAASFDGSNDAVHSDQVLSANPQTAFSLAAWVNISSATGWKTIIGTDGSKAEITLRNQTIRFGRNGSGGWWLVGSTVDVGSWNHVVGVYDCFDAYLYVNGALVAGPISRDFADDHGISVIGRYASTGGEWMNGLIDDAHIYDAALSASDVSDLYFSEVAADGPPVSGASEGEDKETVPAIFVSIADHDLPTREGMSDGIVTLDARFVAEYANRFDLPGEVVTFEIREDGKSDNYRIMGGLFPGDDSLFDTGSYDRGSATVHGMPMNGADIYVTMMVERNGSWYSEDFVFGTQHQE